MGQFCCLTTSSSFISTLTVFYLFLTVSLPLFMYSTTPPFLFFNFSLSPPCFRPPLLSPLILLSPLPLSPSLALDELLSKDSQKRRLMESMTVRESASYAMARVHSSLKKVAVYLVSLCHVDPAAQRLTSSRYIMFISLNLLKCFFVFKWHLFLDFSFQSYRCKSISFECDIFL